jgi:protein TonB
MLVLGLLATLTAVQDDGAWGHELPDAILAKVVTPNDYPAASLRRNEVGSVTFGVVIGTDGLVKGCTILQSSKSPRLDSRTCELMQARLRFKPAHDANGNAVEDHFWGKVNWVLN